MEKIDWMLGMSENMMNICQKHMSDNMMMRQMYQMSSSLIGNLNYIKLMMSNRTDMYFNLDMVENMFRNMEEMMMNMDVHDERQVKMMRSMMGYMVDMQIMMITMMR